MTLQNESRPVATGGFDKSSLLGGLDNREIARKFVSAQAAYPSADDVRRAILRELFAEAVTIAIGLGLNCLRASQYGDDESVLAEFRLDALDDGAQCAFTKTYPGPREPGGYPKGFYDWPLEKRDAWFAGFNLGLIDLARLQEEEAQRG
jgi:hypothetical protein